jgi:SPP1 gp7 family putative phage head morphogenesis protein
MFALDRAGTSKVEINRARRAEIQYAAQLRKVARHIGDMISAVWDPDEPGSAETIAAALGRYAKTIEPWATSVARRMLAEVAARDRKVWKDIARQMGRALHLEIATTPTGALMQRRLADQVVLITSLPTEAAQRVRKLTTEALTNSTRASEIAAEIMRSGEVTASRATLIARTEVSRTATDLTRARSEHIGSTMFIWRTAGDSDVRASHRRLNGKAFRWDDPPECDPGHHALPGAIWNCRCYPEPIIE